ncbi:MAG: hypothetical protein IJK23_14480 [Clostridia bacterium]|nr:hypothetical protein [Clostridia bacterium]
MTHINPAYRTAPDMNENIRRNEMRLSAEPYAFPGMCRGGEYGWPGDFEGRALLAFLCHYQIGGRKIPALDQMMQTLPEHTNGYLFIGKIPDGKTVHEQQLSGHNWYLRAMVAHARAFGDPLSRKAAESTFAHLFLPALPFYDSYPLERTKKEGGVDGHISETQGGWLLSTDVGCAFMCVDGVARYYELTGDERAKKFLEKVIGVFLEADMVKRGFQTHTSLTCLRGTLCFYETTGEEKYLQAVIREFDRYLKYGMTLTYENFNWFGREDIWTEPCAVVDSLLLATRLYSLTGEDRYRVLARRIWFNGLQFCQRENGGAGTSKCVTKEQPVLSVNGYEATQCCTMRYAEGLLCAYKNRELLSWDPDAEIITEPDGRRYCDDRLIVRANGIERPIFSCNTYDKDEALSLRLEVLF